MTANNENKIANRKPKEGYSRNVGLLLPKRWQNFLSCSIVYLIIPLCPIIFSLIKNNKVSESDILLSAAMYTITIAISSKERMVFWFGFLAGLVLSFAYGNAANPEESIGNGRLFGVISICLFFSLHLLERYYRHILYNEDFK